VPAIDTIHGTVTFSNSTVTAITMDSTDSLTVRNFKEPNKAYVLQMWSWLIAAGYVRLRSPRMHDNVQGTRVRIPAALAMHVLPYKHKMQVYAQDTMIGEIYSADASGNIEELMIQLYYEDIPGINARLIGPDELKARRRMTLAAECAPTALATGLYSSPVAINSVYDLLKANTDYAVLGALTDARCSLVTLKGPDTGNLRVGVPGEYSVRHEYAHWFENLSYHLGIPLIPVFNSANKFNTFCELVGNSSTSSAINVSWILAELAP
jgi:hypothetical protein